MEVEQVIEHDIALPPGRWVPRGAIKVYEPLPRIHPDWRENGVERHVPRPPCGTQAAYRRHLREGEQTCSECRRAHRDYQAAGYTDDYLRPTKPCGTHAAFNRHKKRGERPCLDCYEAEREYQNARKRDRPNNAERRAA